MEKCIYVLRSECGTITKFGNSQTVDCRIDSICFTEKRKYYLVYQSDLMDEYEATKLEGKISNHFKQDIVKGREWLSTHPLDVIKFIVSVIGLKKKDELLQHINNVYPCWIALSQDYKKCDFEQPNGVRIGSDYTAYVRFVYNSQFTIVGFCNLGDANKFARSVKHNIISTKIITELLFNMTWDEWVKERIKTRFKKWLLL